MVLMVILQPMFCIKKTGKKLSGKTSYIQLAWEKVVMNQCGQILFVQTPQSVETKMERFLIRISMNVVMEIVVRKNQMETHVNTPQIAKRML